MHPFDVAPHYELAEFFEYEHSRGEGEKEHPGSLFNGRLAKKQISPRRVVDRRTPSLARCPAAISSSSRGDEAETRA